MATIALNAGSNLGNRRLNLTRALKAIGETFGKYEISHVVESEPWGFDSTNCFLNVGIVIESEMAPVEILKEIKKIEKKISSTPHRDGNGNYCDRIIDIDIIVIDELIINEEELQIPHRHLSERRFFLEPLHELMPLWKDPISGKTASEMLSQLDYEESADHK